MAYFIKDTMPNAVQTYNINETDIWKSVNNIGYTRYINVTDGTTRSVPWGALDWVNIIWGNLLGTAIIAGLFYLGAKLIFKF